MEILATFLHNSLLVYVQLQSVVATHAEEA